MPEDSADAKKWPLYTGIKEDTVTAASSQSSINPDLTLSQSSPSPAAEPARGPSESTLESLAGTSAAATSGSSTASVNKHPTKRPGPRKSRTTLGPIPGPAKAKKLTTLDKSAMDWKKHLEDAGSSVTDELEANRRGGGYLEKVEFLKRVEERKEETLDALKSNKRRKL